MPLKGLDPAMAGLKIVQVSDLHFSPVVWQRYLVQYVRWVGDIVRGDLGTSITGVESVSSAIASGLPKTMSISIVAFIISLMIAIPAGILSALKRNTPLDFLVSIFAFLGVSMPSFWFGIILILVFGIWLGWLPVPPRERPSYELVVALGADTLRRSHPVRVLPPAAAALALSGPLPADTPSLAPMAGLMMRDDESVRVAIDAPSNATAWVTFDGGLQTLTASASPERFQTEVPASLLRRGGTIFVARGSTGMLFERKGASL